MKRYLTIFTLLALMMSLSVYGQEEKKPDWRKLHYLSEEEMNNPERGVNFIETDPPTGEVRFVGEFEPMQSVMIRYPLGIPVSLVAQLAQNCQVITVVSSSQQSSAMSTYQSAGVNMNNCVFLNAPTDSYWIRDYGPWYIFENTSPAIVDNVYNRPRPNDDEIPGYFATYWNIPMYGMNLEHTGGNMMEDGRGHGVSDELVVQENNNNETNVRNKMRDYLGIDPYHITIDPQGDYIAHVDCWGKYLAPDKILIARVPQSNTHYADYESVATYFSTTNCCWGYPYRVYRVDEPGGYTLAPYTNSLILNDKVYVPLGSNATYNADALAVYGEAMPGYEIIGVSSDGWENTDALHCRTRGVMDFNMLFVDHRNVIHGEQAWQDSIPVVSKFIAYSGQALKQDSLLVYYSIDGGSYHTVHMTATGNPNEYVGYIKGYQGESTVDYYVFGADMSGHRYTQPHFAAADPHHFTMEEHQFTNLSITPDTLWYREVHQLTTTPIIITNNTGSAVTITSVSNHGAFDVMHNMVALPHVLQSGESISVEISIPAWGYKGNSKGYLTSYFNIVSNLGTQTVVLMANEIVWNDGLMTFPSGGVELTVATPTNSGLVANQNRIGDITVLSIEEQGTDYLNIEYTETLPKVLAPSESFNVQFSLKDKAPMESTELHVLVENSEETYAGWNVFVENGLLNVSSDMGQPASLFPNPATSSVTVSTWGKNAIEVFNVIGQRVYATTNLDNNVTIDVSSWTKGIYSIRTIGNDGSTQTSKLVVK